MKHQFTSEHAAIDYARMLAAVTACPVLVMYNKPQRAYTVGLRTLPAIRQSGQHVASVHRSGLVEKDCLKQRWFRLSQQLCLCE